ncbi:Multidrug resistance-associated protein 1 [Bulinus truncatus]|nr:Multidrug resistance-associated protein 1 [Bulinus truncatus]
MFLATALSLLSLIIIIEDFSNDYTSSPVPTSQYTSNGIRVISYVAVALLIHLERRCHVTTSGLFFVFWLILVLCDVVPLYSKIILQEYEQSLMKFALFSLTYVMELLQLVLNCFVDSAGVEAYHAKTSPEVVSSFPSQVFYWWVTKTVYQGWRRDLQEDDLFNLNPRDESDALIPIFEKLWTNEIVRFKRKKNAQKRNRDNLLSYAMSDYSYSYENVNEKSHLLSNGGVYQNGTSNKTQNEEHTAEHTKKEPKPSLLKVLGQMVATPLLIGLVQKVISDIFLMLSPILLSLLISYAENKDTDFVWKGYALGVLLFLTQMAKSVLFNFSFWMSQIVGMQMKTTLVAAIYKKALTMNSESKKDSTAGEIVNLMSVDCQRVQDVMNFFFFAWTTPLQVVIAIAVLYSYIGVSVFAGLAVLLLTVPLNSYVAAKQQELQVENLKHKDARLRLTNEALCGMKVLKLYAWEPPFHRKISDIRSNETGILLKIAYLNVLISVCFNAAPYLIMLATFAVYVNISDENHLDANRAFVALSFFNLLRVPLGLLSTIISMSVQAIVSVERINSFLCTGDLRPDNVIKDSRANFAIEVENGTFTWDTSSSPILKNINIKISEGKLYAVVGPVGSGKSSLMCALLGEMERLTGIACIKSKVAYVPQQAWIQNATLKDNILFGKPFNKKRYKKVIEACALERDLEILSAGDMTEIGEKGINLSGGQKQRVSLARAVYSNADIYIFDDPLSAVDSHVGKHIFNSVIGRKGILKGKTRVLVTHGAHWLPMVDSIIVLDNGEIKESGSYEDLMAHNGAFAEFIRTYLLQGEEDKETSLETTAPRVWNDGENGTSDYTSGDEAVGRLSRVPGRRTMSLTYESSLTSSLFLHSQTVIYEEEDRRNPSSGKLVQAEKMEIGKVKMAVFWTYAKATGTFAIMMSFLFFVLFQVASAWSNFWLSDWTEDSYLANLSLIRTDHYKETNDYYLYIFGVFGITQVVFLTVHNVLYWVRMVVAAKRLHFGMLTSIVRSPMSFFDTTPLGRIMNRFSRDIEVVDNNLPIIIRDYLSTLFTCIMTLIIISMNTPLFLTLVFPIMIMYYFIQNFYIPTSRQLKRIESVTRSPIYTHFSETISGGPTIRAYDASARFIKESKTRVDKNQSYYYISLAANRWLGMSLELLANIIILGSAIFAVVTPGINGGAVGLSVSYAIQVSSNLVWMVRQMSDLETNIVSVERLKEYSELPSEADWIIPQRRPVPGWPLEGRVKFSNYQTRYREGLDLVLKGITCEFKPGEKIGIVGRTGAGKSSLALALFRLIEAVEGNISVDGIRISDIGLHDVRSRLTILPQDPVLFFGTLRMNLDPIDEYDDSQIWNALTSAHLKDFVENIPEGLAYEVGEEGQSLSVGQRQLVCLARALLKKTKILILDEATAAVDMETDTLIQNTIRTEFSDCTIITIAHRLNTIMDYDRIMVLDAGLVKELDSPSNLLANPRSIFYSMAKEANLV